MLSCAINRILTHSRSLVLLLRGRQMSSHARISQRFMEPAGSLPCSQEPSTSPYPEPDQSNPYHPILEKYKDNKIIYDECFKMLPTLKLSITSI
jgi:hypothetical protein